MAKWSALALVSALLLGCSSAVPVQEAGPVPDQRLPAVPVAAARFTFKLHRRMFSWSGESTSWVSRFRKFTQVDPLPAGRDVALSVRQVEYLLNVTAGGRNYSMIIDTGSSDTWFVKNGFLCLNAYRQVVDISQCRFGPAFQGDFSGGKIPGQKFNISYGDPTYGPTLLGDYGYADLTIAGVKIPNQQTALATMGYWSGDQISTGILGLGMPGLTEAIVSTGDPAANKTTKETYSPVVTTMSRNANVASLFSMGLSRDPAKSFIALGGVPPNVTDGNYVSTPLLQWPLLKGGSDYLWYTIQIEQMVWRGANATANDTMSQGPRAIIDSGTTLNMLPIDVATAINDAYVPPAVYDTSEGIWMVDCNAIPPSFGIQIGGQVLWTEPTNMILTDVRNSAGKCATGIAATYQDPYILGDAFMQNLVAVFDLGERKELRLAKRA